MASSSQQATTSTVLPQIISVGGDLEDSGNLNTRNTNQLKLIIEKRIDFDSLAANEYNDKEVFNA
jgi:hypothetical protein